MKSSISHRSAGSLEMAIELGRDGLGKRRYKRLTVRGTKAQVRRKQRDSYASVALQAAQNMVVAC